jgi:hypothetical protein
MADIRALAEQILAAVPKTGQITSNRHLGLAFDCLNLNQRYSKPHVRTWRHPCGCRNAERTRFARNLAALRRHAKTEKQSVEFSLGQNGGARPGAGRPKAAARAGDEGSRSRG